MGKAAALCPCCAHSVRFRENGCAVSARLLQQVFHCFAAQKRGRKTVRGTKAFGFHQVKKVSAPLFQVSRNRLCVPHGRQFLREKPCRARLPAHAAHVAARELSLRGLCPRIPLVCSGFGDLYAETDGAAPFSAKAAWSGKIKSVKFGDMRVKFDTLRKGER